MPRFVKAVGSKTAVAVEVKPEVKEEVKVEVKPVEKPAPKPMPKEEGFGEAVLERPKDMDISLLKEVKLSVKPTFCDLKKEAPCHWMKISKQEKCLCPRFNLCGTAVPPEGNRESPYIFIGRDPGEQEVDNKKPFFPDAPGGKLFVQYLEALGLTRGDVYITNCLFCRAPNNAPPTPEESFACSHFHVEEFKALKGAKYFFPMGSNAFQMITGVYSSVTPFVGSFFRTSFYGIKDAIIVPVHHPGYLLRRPSEGEFVFKILRSLSLMK